MRQYGKCLLLLNIFGVLMWWYQVQCIARYQRYDVCGGVACRPLTRRLRQPTGGGRWGGRGGAPSTPAGGGGEAGVALVGTLSG